MSVLAKEPLGSFMVRNSETQPGTFALSVRVPKSFHPLGITHYIIHQLEEGYQIKVTKNLDKQIFRKYLFLSNFFPSTFSVENNPTWLVKIV